MIHLETWGTAQPCVAFSTSQHLNFVLVSLFLAEHMTLNFLTLHKSLSVCLMSGLFS